MEGGGFQTLITNEYDPPRKDLIATKTWEVDPDSALLYPNAWHDARQDIWMQLFRKAGSDGTQERIAKEDGGLLHLPADAAASELTWYDMPMETKQAVAYTYWVEEVDDQGNDWQPLNFTKSSPSDMAITNSFLKEAQRTGELRLEKHLRDARGRLYGQEGYADPVADRQFTLFVIGPYGYRQTVTLKAGEGQTLTGLAYGEYVVLEDDVDPTVYETPVYQVPDPDQPGAYLAQDRVTLGEGENKGLIIVSNKEKPVGQLRLIKMGENSKGLSIINQEYPDDPAVETIDERVFTFLVEGPIYPGMEEADYPAYVSDASPDGKVEVNSNTTGVLLDGMPLGKYRISEVDTVVFPGQMVDGELMGRRMVSDLYTMPEPFYVTLHARQQTGETRLTNQEKDAGEITLHKTVLDADGNEIEDGRKFSVLVASQQHGYSQIHQVEAGKQTTITGLAFGKYTVIELDSTGAYSTGYSLSEDGQPQGDYSEFILTLEEGAHHKYRQDVYITNQELAIGQLVLSKRIINTSGGSDASNPDQEPFEVEVRGPGAYQDGRVLKLPADGEQITLRNLQLGTYTVKELAGEGYDLDDYIITDPAPIVIGYDKDSGLTQLHREAQVINTEKALGQLVVEKLLLDNLGNLIPDTDQRRFNVTITGPAFGPEGYRLSLKGGQRVHLPIEGDGIAYGNYAVIEDDYSANYYTTISEPVSLHTHNKQGLITITNTERARGQLGVKLVVYDAQGNVIEDDRSFTIWTSGPSFAGRSDVETLTNGVLTQHSALIYGSYAVSLAQMALLQQDYEISIDPAVTLDVEHRTGAISIIMKEKPLGKPTVSAEVLDADGDPVPAGRKVTVTVKGPDGYSQDVVITIGEPFPVLEGLTYGEYSIEADDPNYIIMLPKPVTLSISDKEGELKTIFQERKDGKLTISAEVLDADGDPVPAGRKVTVTVKGPGGYSQDVVIAIGQPFPVLEGLPYGEYSIEANHPNYIITLPKPVTLTVTEKEGELKTIFQEIAPRYTLKLGVLVYDEKGQEISLNTSFILRLFGRACPRRVSPMR